MFITLTIDTHQKKKSMLRLNTTRMNPANGWKKALNTKKRSMWQRVKAWKRELKTGYYKLDGQPAMF